MSAESELTDQLLAAVRGVPGLHPAAPTRATKGLLTSWNSETLAVDLGAEEVVIRLAATRLPLPPLLDRLTNALVAVLAESSSCTARLRLVVTDLDRAAFDDVIE
ncbi:MAG: hypothetical protein ACRDQ7_17375 [Haloechinothrix sp.]